MFVKGFLRVHTNLMCFLMAMQSFEGFLMVLNGSMGL